MSSLTEIQYVQIEPSEKGANINESMILKYRLWKISIGLFISFLSLQLNEFLLLEIKTEIAFSSKNHLYYCNCC